MFNLMIFFYDQKRDMTSSFTWSEGFEDFGSFLKYIFAINWQVFAVFLYKSLSYSWVINI